MKILPFNKIKLLFFAAEVITENYNRSECRDQLTVSYPLPVYTSTMTPFHLRLKEHHGRGDRKIIKALRPGYLLWESLF